MNILIAVLGLVVSSLGGLSADSSTTEKFDWSIFNNIVSKPIEQTTNQPTYSPPFPKFAKPSHFNQDASLSADSESPEELIARLFREPQQNPSVPSPHLPPDHETPTHPHSSNLIPITRTVSSSRPVFRATKPSVAPHSNNNAPQTLPSLSANPQMDSFYPSPSHNFQPSTPQQHESPPPFYYIPQELFAPYNPSLSNNQQANEMSLYQFPYIPTEVSSRSLPSILYQGHQIPIMSSAQPLTQSPQVRNGPYISYSTVPFVSSNSVPYQSLPSLTYSPQIYGTPGQIIASFVRTYVPQNQFHPVQFHSLQPPLGSSGYGPQPHQLSQDDIISLIQNSHPQSLPDKQSPPVNPRSFSVPTYSNQHNFVPVPANIAADHVPKSYSSSFVQNLVPSSTYEEQRSLKRSGSPPIPVPESGSFTPFLNNPYNLHFI